MGNNKREQSIYLSISKEYGNCCSQGYRGLLKRTGENNISNISDDDGQQQQQQTEQSTIRRGGGEGRIREELVWNLEREREAHKRQSAAIFYDWHQDTRKRERRTKNKRRAACTHIYRGRERGG